MAFLLDTASPYTYISVLTLKRISKDCKVKQGTPSKVPVVINGWPMETRVSKEFNEDVNILGMDFMKQNNVEFTMKLNNRNRDESKLLLKFGKEKVNEVI